MQKYDLSSWNSTESSDIGIFAFKLDFNGDAPALRRLRPFAVLPLQPLYPRGDHRRGRQPGAVWPLRFRHGPHPPRALRHANDAAALGAGGAGARSDPQRAATP